MLQFLWNENEDCNKLLGKATNSYIVLTASEQTPEQKNYCGVFNKRNENMAL